ncbi:hypothetical protein [Salsipaludibacter albus]|uniref:hypothetical protein n=1 Tax=Salsipaludibacter albus TaxID=2849650 RepID=UPI001EE4434E|nr:hypothetical protein [Salsipaludibacter albus]MBY5163539.1 hypothetical protein [Salsipaludibacter albus]
MTVGQDLARAYLDVVAGRDASRQRWLDRGRRGAGHHVDALRIEPGRARLRVPSPRGRSPEVVVTVPMLAGEDWEHVIEVAGRNLRSTADLLAGRLPEDLARPELLVPDSVEASCSADARQCPHEAVAHHVVAVAIERDPFRLLQWRGHRRQDLLGALRRARGAVSAGGDDSIDLSDPFTARGDLDLPVHPHPPADLTALIDRLGPPPGIEEPDELEDAIAAAAAMAWRLAAGEGGDVADDEVLLAELRAQRVTSAERLADALGLDEQVVTDHLDRLYEGGAVMRMGAGSAAKYRAA